MRAKRKHPKPHLLKEKSGSWKTIPMKFLRYPKLKTFMFLISLNIKIYLQKKIAVEAPSIPNGKPKESKKVNLVFVKYFLVLINYFSGEHSL